MDTTSQDRQQRFREKMKEEGKRQRVFFLSDSAMDRIKIHKEKSNSASMNHALESLLTAPTAFNFESAESQKVEPAEPIIEQKEILSDEHKEIIEIVRQYVSQRGEIMNNKHLNDSQREAIMTRCKQTIEKLYTVGESLL